MPKPSIDVPRSFMTHPDLFGRPGEPLWQDPSTVQGYVGLRAAEVQHHVSVALSDRQRAGLLTVGGLEVDAGLARGRMSKLLRGYSHMSLRDLQAIEGVVGPILMLLNFDRVVIKNEALRRRFISDAARWSPRVGP